ncbi:MAG: hypothetical protein R3C24_19070 [Cyanobacteriota/Melainabacteria group bacterium]
MTSDKALYSPFGFDETLAKIVQALSESATDSSHWEPEQFEKQGLIRHSCDGGEAASHYCAQYFYHRNGTQGNDR